MPVHPIEAIVPPDGLWRIGRGPDPLDWPPRRPNAGHGRFDDARSEFRTLYAAERRQTCFIETLAGFRASLEWIEAARRVRAAVPTVAVSPGAIPSSWLQSRLIGRLRPMPDQRWLDLRSLESRIALRYELAGELIARGLTDFDLSDALSRERAMTQRAARWAYETGYSGIAYTSRFGCPYNCWVLFERATFVVDVVESINRADPDLLEVVRLFDLQLPPGDQS
jgi:hypothetical protein